MRSGQDVTHQRSAGGERRLLVPQMSRSTSIVQASLSLAGVDVVQGVLRDQNVSAHHKSGGVARAQRANRLRHTGRPLLPSRRERHGAVEVL